ncbi:MAG: 50S ribosomal protein L21 [Candidatus Omnitrophica bacterium]|nr:50S ribosomal protein L21 [Candidatus Omnitrophota bacterium]
MVYAIIRTGGKQQRVSVGDRFDTEKLANDVNDTIELSEVLAVGEGADLQVGTPYLDGAKVVCEVIRQDRGKKILIGKYKRRKNYYRKNGHRQSFTRLRVDAIQADGINETASSSSTKSEAPAAEAPAAEAAGE